MKYITRQNKLLFVIAVSIIFAILTIVWARQDSPIFRPLVQDMRLVDAVLISDVLDQERIAYYADVKSQMLYVDQAKTEHARVSLAKVGIVIDYPKITKYSDLDEAYHAFLEQNSREQVKAELWEQPWFFRVVRLAAGALIILVLILNVVRPALRAIILEQDK
ncbi:hypothetical protein [Pseudoalteromonas luteoviolacea]|uniref:Flagellar M-ring N-terminal domain-containing protein n=1 Tax=Pseudoalteromonas luteoviolacea S4054 TaxID=1129367 RepID=A0A0F6AGK2_9GAMM|nr:hypothetical protein [Pseudoalteromonas luteoviolacea]AOT08133.1 hypothetical protein S4054249_09880 [Pseudoalteromonas luteoviolacea]AOT13050.1 hypothetical protein S40542_09880 [Pseudoalteromonas luteoviolacea]AOT17962.1 hypothetical protein S4054_09875 [Pseudoalteromonas luteoviolacea]KKE84524.1 hypothetical protein N479_08860 [Pseudoalteromonas luteoviolacea S4054]KZN69502.1 hypothetical protein N481_22180 [Pseudoalteromonas luteoviolacea S4047-1]